MILCSGSLVAQAQPSLDQRIQAVMSRPEFAHARFGIEFYSIEQAKPIYTLNAQELFVPGSTTKLLTEGTSLELLGDDYRFHTRVYRTGELKKNGTLKGDIVVVASGDPDLSNRIQPDGTLTFENEDHSYGGVDSHGLTGDPLLVIREFANQIAAKGIRRIEGRVLVDTSLFPEGARELGTGVVISPMVVDDNVVDVIVTPGANEGSAPTLKISPQSKYLTFINHAKTGKPGSRTDLNYEDEKLNADGTRSVALTGTITPGPAQMVSYPIPEPGKYAAVLLTEVLEQQSVQFKVPKKPQEPDFKALAANYKPENLVAEHVSPPFKEDVRITLKVSQNLHASSMPYILGAILGHATKDIDQAGFDLENGFLRKANLDLTAASQSDGAGGNAYFTPEFMVNYLRYMHAQSDFDNFYRGLPLLGRDGTLAKIEVNSPAAGHVHAKTGTYGVYDALNKNLLVTGKGLAGFMETASGQHLIFALYVNNVPVPLDDPDAAQKIAGEALGQIAAAAYGE